MQKTIGIIGQGFVGSAVNEGLNNFFNIETYDIKKESTCESISDLCSKCDIIFVCLPTPMEEVTGECHLGIIEPVLDELNQCNKKTIIVKSTIPPGTTKNWNEKT